MTSTSALALRTSSPKAVCSDSTSAQTALFEPSWTRAITTSASPLASSPSESCAATRSIAANGSPKSSIVIPDGDTSEAVSAVTAPTKPSFTPPFSITANSGSSGFVVPLA